MSKKGNETLLAAYRNTCDQLRADIARLKQRIDAADAVVQAAREVADSMQLRRCHERSMVEEYHVYEDDGDQLRQAIAAYEEAVRDGQGDGR